MTMTMTDITDPASTDESLEETIRKIVREEIEAERERLTHDIEARPDK